MGETGPDGIGLPGTKVSKNTGFLKKFYYGVVLFTS